MGVLLKHKRREKPLHSITTISTLCPVVASLVIKHKGNKDYIVPSIIMCLPSIIMCYHDQSEAVLLNIDKLRTDMKTNSIHTGYSTQYR